MSGDGHPQREADDRTHGKVYKQDTASAADQDARIRELLDLPASGSLSDWRRADLHASGITDEAIAAAGVQDNDRNNGWRLRWTDGLPLASGSPGMNLLVFDRDKRPTDGRKVDWPTGQTSILGCLRLVRESTRDIICEGPRQALSVLSYAPADVSVWVMNGDHGIHHKIKDRLARFAGHDVVLVFDGDWRRNPQVGKAATETVPEVLDAVGAASVHVADVGGIGKDGIDDILARTKEDERAKLLATILEHAAPAADRRMELETERELIRLRAREEAKRRFSIEQRGPEQDRNGPLFINGEEFLNLAVVTAPPLWGAGDVCLWAPGESLMPVGPPGVGKSTLAHLLIWARLGLLDNVLGWPVQTADGKVLYLAMDRPAQIARAMRRLIVPEHWPTVRERITVRPGPLPVDLCREPAWIRDHAQEVGASVVVIDSLKDVLPNPSDEDAAGTYHRARNLALAAGIEWVELHHNRKAGAGNKEPNTLDDVYGSRWLTAGAGSVLSLYGEAGDTVVSLKQLKAPAGEFFPRRILLDKDRGQMSLYEDQTVESLLAAVHGGTSARLLARKLYDTEKPTVTQIEATRNKLKRLVARGEAVEYASPVDKSQMFRAIKNPNANVGKSQRGTNAQSTGSPTTPTDEASALVRDPNVNPNDSNEPPTHRGSLRDPDVGGDVTARTSNPPCPRCGDPTVVTVQGPICPSCDVKKKRRPRTRSRA
jgi:hypothetical protein